MINGIINVYKEKGYTSHDVVARLRGILHQKKIGHTGTLDPNAEGVLPVCLGKGTKLCDMLTDTDKEYRAVIRLGVKTDTQDITGTVIEKREVNADISEEKITEVIMSFVGEYMQIPPMYSALKVDGKRLYELARQGKEVERKARKVFITHIVIEEINVPFITMTVGCSKGTYIRTLCQDIGEKLGTLACMESLIRTKAGFYKLENSLKLYEIEQLREAGELSSIVKSVDSCFSEYSAVYISEECNRLVYNGNAFFKEHIGKSDVDDYVEGLYRVYDSYEKFIGVYRLNSKGMFKVEKFFMETE